MVMSPSYPAAGSWFTPTGGWTPPVSLQGSPYGSQPYTPTQAPTTPPQPVSAQPASQRGGYPANPSINPSQATEDARRWDAYLQQLQESLQASAGWARTQLESQVRDAQEARQNAWKIAELSAQTSRYGVDKNTEVALAQLTQRQREFDQNHGLEMQRFGLEKEKFGEDTRRFGLQFGLEQQKHNLNYAGQAAQYLSTPDRYFQAADFMNMGSRYLAGQPGAAPYGSTGSPTPKTEQDFAILQQGGNPSAGGGGAAQAAAAGGSGGDQRVKALTGLLKAMPPSETDGLDPNDYAVLNAAKALYSTNLRPGTLESMRPGQRAIFKSAGQRLGYDVNDWEANYRRSAPGMGRASAA